MWRRLCIIGGNPETSFFCVDATVGLIRAEGLFQITHHMDSRGKGNSGRNILFFKGLFDIRDSLIWIYFRLCDFG